MLNAKQNLSEQPPEWIEEMILNGKESDQHLEKISEVPQQLVEKAKEAFRKAIEHVVKSNYAPGTKEFKKAMKELGELRKQKENIFPKHSFWKRLLQKIFKF